MSSDESSAVQPGPLIEPTTDQEGLSSFAAPDSGDEVAHEALTVSSAKAPLDTESILMQKLSDLEAELAQANGKIVDLESKQWGGLFSGATRAKARSRGASLPSYTDSSSLTPDAVTIRELQGRVSLLTFQLDKATRATAHFEAQVEELRTSGATAGQSVLEGSQVTPQLKQYLEELEGRVGVLLTKNQELEHSLKDKEEALSRERYEVQTVQSRAAELQEQLTAHSLALRELEKEHVVNLGLRVKTEELLQERAALQQRLLEQSEEAKRLSVDLRGVQGAKEMLEKSTKTMDDQLQAALGDKAELSHQVSQLRKELQDATADIAAKHIKLNTLQQELKASGDPIKASLAEKLAHGNILPSPRLLLKQGSSMDEEALKQMEDEAQASFMSLPAAPTKKNVIKQARRHVARGADALGESGTQKGPMGVLRRLRSLRAQQPTHDALDTSQG